MLTFPLLLVMCLALALAAIAERHKLQAPLLLASVGLVVSMIPGIPRVELEPEIILNLVVPPLLYSAALEFSFSSFMKRIGGILNLGVLLVIATTAAVAVAVSWVLPELSLPLAFILGAAVAPPDAVSAISIGRKLGLPTKLMTVLKGESLINDAAALALFSGALAAATGSRVLFGIGLVDMLYMAVGGMIVGITIGLTIHYVRRTLMTGSLATAIAILAPFAAYALAEVTLTSGVVAVVFAGFTLGQKSTEMHFSGRIQERESWKVVDTLLEAFVFAYMGLQFRFIAAETASSRFDFSLLACVTVVIFATVVVTRVAWVFFSSSVCWVRERYHSQNSELEARLGWRENIVMSWAGMRGVVTIAAAAGIPHTTTAGAPLEGRHAVIFIAFGVAMATLLLQGLTLPLLIRVLGVNNSLDVAREKKQYASARAIMHKAGTDALTTLEERGFTLAELRVARMIGAIGVRLSKDETVVERSVAISPKSLAAADLLLHSQRQLLIEERDAGGLDEEVVREVLTVIDLQQAALGAHAEKLQY